MRAELQAALMRLRQIEETAEHDHVLNALGAFFQVRVERAASSARGAECVFAVGG
jgi:hypothetical protein